MYALTNLAWDFIFAHDELVFARTTPEQKLQIVRACRERGHRVGVTGELRAGARVRSNLCSTWRVPLGAGLPVATAPP